LRIFEEKNPNIGIKTPLPDHIMDETLSVEADCPHQELSRGAEYPAKNTTSGIAKKLHSSEQIWKCWEGICNGTTTIVVVPSGPAASFREF
jgi:hypothetical protein